MFLTFERNRDARLWDNGRARIPCRTTGDLLVSSLAGSIVWTTAVFW